ncbi:MAG: acyltransferase [Bacteroidales bacterium]|nr:acyltransferase [Bacteroidales bacterium]
MASYRHDNWRGRTDGTPWMQRTLVKMLRFIPVEFIYGIVALVIPFYLMFDARARRASWQLFRRRLGRSFLRSLGSVYLNEFMLGLVVVDRFASYAGKKFRLETSDKENFDRLSAQEEGFVQLFAHLGNSEMAGYVFPSVKRIHVLVYAGETARMMQGREELFTQKNVEMVPVNADMSHIFTLDAALSQGQIASMPADRSFGSPRTASYDFLGAAAKFPVGPFHLAVSRDVPAAALFVMKTSVRSYRAYHIPLVDVRGKGLSRQEAVDALMRDYVARLEEMVRQYPQQWFNFYDFWA